MVTLFARFASSNECPEWSIRVYKKLLGKRISLAFVNFSSAAMCEAPLGSELSTGFFAPCTHLRSVVMQNFDSYYTKLYTAVFALLENAKSAATAADRTPRNTLMTQVSAPSFEKRATTQELAATAMKILYCSKKVSNRAADPRRKQLCSQLCTAIGASSPHNRSEFFSSLFRHFSSPIFSPLIRRFICFRRQVLVPIVKVSSTD